MESYMNVGAAQIAVQEFPDTLQSWKREGNRFYFYCTDAALEVIVKTDKILRFRFATEGEFMRDFSYSLAHEYNGEVKFLDVVEEEEQVVIITSYLEVSICKKGLKIKILDKNGL